jgi:hypothetical protein
LLFTIFSRKGKRSREPAYSLRHYGKKRILDVTQTRLFTFRLVRELLKQSGYQVLEARGRKRNPMVNNLPRETISSSDGLKAEVLGAWGLNGRGAQGNGDLRM